MARSRPFAVVLAVLVLVLAGPAFAKKKKGGAKKHKTPSGKSMGAEPKDTAEDESSGSEDSGKSAKESDEDAKPSAKSPPPEPVGDEKPAATEGEGEGADGEGKPKKKAKPAAEGEGGGEGTGAPAALELVVGAGGVNRNLSYNDDRSMQIAPYALPVGPEARVAFELYPAAFATSGFAANIGLIGQLGYGFGVKSKTQTGNQLTTQFMDFAVGLKLRIPLGMVSPYASGSYAAQAFQLNGQMVPATGPPVPAVGYKLIRAGLGARFQFTPMIDLDVGGAFLLLTDAGQIRSLYWPHTTGNGVEAGFSLGVRLTNLIGLRGGLDFRQYGLAFNWRAPEMYQSGGALDRFITFWGGLSITLDGVAGEGEEAPKPEPKAKKKKKAEPEEGEEEKAPE